MNCIIQLYIYIYIYIYIFFLNFPSPTTLPQINPFTQKLHSQFPPHSQAAPARCINGEHNRSRAKQIMDRKPQRTHITENADKILTAYRRKYIYFLIILLHVRNSIDKIILSRNVMSGAGDPFFKRVLSLEIIWCPVPFVFM